MGVGSTLKALWLVLVLMGIYLLFTLLTSSLYTFRGYSQLRPAPVFCHGDVQVVMDRIHGQGCILDEQTDIGSSMFYFPSQPVQVNIQLMNRFYQVFVASLCTLPLEYVDTGCSFNRHISNIFCDITVAKMVRLWTLVLTREAIGNDKVAGRLKHFIFNEADINSFHWDVHLKNCGHIKSNISQYFVNDYCPVMFDNNTGYVDIDHIGLYTVSDRSVLKVESQNMIDLMKSANKMNSAPFALLMTGMFLRNILEDRLGNCLKSTIQEFLKNKVMHAAECSGDSPVLALHIRHGDSCGVVQNSTGWNHSTRPCFTFDVYAKYILQMKTRYQMCRIRLATDSSEMVQKVVAFSKKHALEVSYLKFERNMFEPKKEGIKGFIENRNWQQEESSAIFLSLLTDMYYLQHADLLVGTASSTLTRLLLFVITARTGRVPPYASMDQSFEALTRLDTTGCGFRWFS